MASDGENAIERRLAAGEYAAAGSERAFAGVVVPALLACRNEAAVEQYLSELHGGAQWYDFFSAAVVGSWLGDEGGTFRWLRNAGNGAADGVAVAAGERLAHYALLFGDVAAARSAIDEALALAKLNRLSKRRLQVAAFGARLAVDAGDAERATQLLAESRAGTADAETIAWFAPAGAQLAVAHEDAEALREWTAPAILATALCCTQAQSAIAATTALLVGGGSVPPPGSPLSVALRRGLLSAGGAAEAVELFSLAARYGDADEARFALDSLRAVPAPHRRYLEAHFLLARAHWCFRFGERSDAIDSAGDAARAFDAMGLRRWTDDAMSLLVHQEGSGDAHRRRRSSAFSLTGREQQVAHLIRRGASNREVARTLQISEHTVERHVSSILSRLGLRSRWQIVDTRNNGT